ncbi:MAG: HAMP domain-containing histidine kinase [Chloroflexi bacterium]|nr:HAMP domain-containing histidine kinase [Chloroflexota bacterium]
MTEPQQFLASRAEFFTTRHIRRLRFALPLGLFLLATLFEGWEHRIKHEPLLVDPMGLLEIFVFGVVGPTAVYLALTYVEHLLQILQQAHSDIAQLNRGLEQKVALRTAELEQANLRLQEMDQIKSDFVSLVSHELRAPLATLNGGLEVALQYKEQLPLKAQRVLHLLLTETARLTEFVRTILDLTQLEAGKLHVHCGPVALKPLLQQAVNVTLGADAGQVVWQLPADIPPLWVDETYTEEVVRNLLRNAHKYSPPQSPIELKVTVAPGQLCLCITDYGPGIPAERQAQVFERFVRMSPGNGHSDQPRGWGLGLYFARMLLQQQGGSLTLQSPAHEDSAAPGCRFMLTLPLAQEEEAQDGLLAAN